MAAAACWMKVLHVITGLGNGGAEAVMCRLIEGSRQDTHVVVSLTRPELYADVLAAQQIPVHTLDMPRGRVTIDGLRRLRQLIVRTRPDAVQTWMYHANLLGGLAARVAGVRNVVWGVHHSTLDPAKTRLSTRLVAGACALLSWTVPRYVICCSARASRVHTRIGYQRSKMVVVSNCVDLAVFAPDAAGRDRVRAELGLAPREILCGMVARWDPLKDHATFLAALARLRQLMPTGWRAILVGSGVTEANLDLMSLLEQHQLMDRVRCLGPRADIPAIMSALDLHVLSSAAEAFGNVTVEAMACGTPAVVTDVGAGEFVVADTGWVVPAGDPIRLSGVIGEAFAAMVDTKQWRLRKMAARARVVSEFGLDRMVDGYRRVWRGEVN
jgi:glycosyltransferase involved in cell wall biosynthesis